MRLRDAVAAVRETGDPGMATGVSGMLTKQGAVVLATTPKTGPVTYDVTNEVAAATLNGQITFFFDDMQIFCTHVRQTI